MRLSCSQHSESVVSLWVAAVLAGLVFACDGRAAPVLDSVDAGAMDVDARVLSDGAVEHWTTLSERPCPTDSIVTWENFGASFVLENCTGCHGRDRAIGQRQGAPLEATFDDPASIRARADRLWARAGDHNRTMPPVGGPPAASRALFAEWLACGAPVRADFGD